MSLSADFRQGLVEIALIDVLRRLGQGLFENPLLGDDFDQRADAFYVDIGVAIPNAAFPVVIRGVTECSTLIAISFDR